jgi:tRNA threonylcarbamoyl adenosine modification protein YjeE
VTVEWVFEGQRGWLRAVGRALGEAAQGGDVVALEGPLGAGKTVLAQAIVYGAGVDPRVRVASPTFSIVQEHVGRLRVQHADLYRLGGPEALDEVGLFSLGVDGLVVVEWPDRAGALVPSEALWVRIERVSPLRRRVRLHGRGERAEVLVAAARVALDRCVARAGTRVRSRQG